VIPLIFDIETKRDQAFLDRQGVEEMLRDRVKTGNAKSLDKVSEKREEGLLKLLERAALDPMTGRIVAIGHGALESDTEPKVIYEDSGDTVADERSVLQQFFDVLLTYNSNHGRPVLCGWNIRGFDLPFLMTRAAILNVEVPGFIPHLRDYRRIVDAMDVLCPDPSRRVPLDLWLTRFGLPNKTGRGSDVENMPLEDVARYCADDVTRTRMLIRRCASMFPALREDGSDAA